MSNPQLPDQPGQPAPGAPKRAGNSVLCPACERLNPIGLEKCDRCGVALFADCGNCGKRNARVTTRCPGCGFRTESPKTFSKFQNLHQSPVFWGFIVVLIVVLLTLLILFWLGGGRLPRL